LANDEAVCAAFNPILNCVMGCISLGNELRSGTTCAGNLAERLCNSAVKVSTCSFVGTSDVNRSQISDSRRGSPSPALPENVGRTYKIGEIDIRYVRYKNEHIMCTKSAKNLQYEMLYITSIHHSLTI